jgi:tripartite-type tricarboxylate transporter receptor subunit TctC
MLCPASQVASAFANYPSHPVRWVVPYAAGGATDVLSRLICQRLTERLGQSFVVGTSLALGAISEPRPSSPLRLTDTHCC